MIWVARNTDPRLALVTMLLERHGRSQRWLASKLGTTPFNVGKWLNPDGHMPRDRGVYDAMLNILREEAPSDKEVRKAGMRTVPIHMGAIPGGDPLSMEGSLEIELMPDWGNDNERWGRPVTGTSMIDALIPNDWAIFEDRQWESGDVCHVFHDGEDAVKCVRVIGGEARCFSFNPEFEPYPLGSWRVKGVCMARIRKGPYGIKQVTEFPHGLKWSMKDIGI